MRERLRYLLQESEAGSFVCVLIFAFFGYFNSPLWVAMLGGVLFGVPSLVRLIQMKAAHPSVRTGWRVMGFYAQAIFHGVCAATAGFFMGVGWRAYWFP